MKTTSIGFIGGGRITRIFLQALKNVELPSIKVYDTNENVLKALKDDFPQIEIFSTITELSDQNIIIIALHPPVIKEVGSEIRTIIKKDSIVISLAPKFTIEKLSEILNTTRIVRVIPNATSYINKGYNPVCFSNNLSEEERERIISMLALMGNYVETEEDKLEAYAIASAMLPTYFWFQWNEMEQIAQKIGLTKEESKNTVYETLKASLDLLYDSKLSYEEVIDLIPVKPIADKEEMVKEALNENLISLYQKIKP